MKRRAGNRSIRIPHTCGWCGETYQAIRSRVESGRTKFCSPSCSSKASIRKHGLLGRKGADNPAWKGGVSLGSHAHYTAEFRAKNPDKVKAQRIAAAAIAKGTLVRPEHCSKCQRQCRPHAHHPDHAFPLTVVWLCSTCHVRHHHLGRRKGDAPLLEKSA